MSKTASSSVPAPSELIMQRPQHTTRLMQTQQTDTRVDTLQEPMQPEELFSEFKAKKRDKPITLVKQDGANCGCFAAGMAIASLIRIREVEKQTDQAWYQEYAFPAVQLKVKQFGQDLAKSIESIAQQQFLSSVGEMFDAKALAETINLVLKDSAIVGQNKAGKYHAKVARFSDEEQLNSILTRADAMGVRVLIPYYSTRAQPTFMSETDTKADKMSHAHWSVMSRYPLENTRFSTPSIDPSKVYIYEGQNRAIKMDVLLSQVAQSNLSLGDSMDWNAYLDTCNPSVQQATIARLRNRVGQTPSPFRNEADVPWLGGAAYKSEQKLFENVNLRGRIILIGKTANTDAPAAPAPTPQTGIVKKTAHPNYPIRRPDSAFVSTANA
nr:hypothetical protein [uncultured Agathobaculum sp.]